MYHLENKKTGRHTYYSALTALIEAVPDLGVSKGKLDRYQWNEDTDFKYQNDKYIVRFGDLLGVAEVRMGELFLEAFNAGFNPIALPLEKAIEIEGKKITYKKGFYVNGNKYSTVNELIKQLN